MASRAYFLVVLIIFVVGGCEDARYPSALTYPPRNDLLVQNPPAVDIRSALPGPGMLDESIAQAGKAKQFQIVDPQDINPTERAILQAALEDHFGTPSAPKIEPDDPERSKGDRPAASQNWKLFSEKRAELLPDYELDDADIEKLFTDSDSQAKGYGESRRSLVRGSELYRRHCLHCHGVSGDGRGSTGPWIHPHPRDYRQGAFKFISTNLSLVGNGKPRKEDLLRILEKGIDGTSMPSFGLLPIKELELLAGYVIYLSIRGQVEYETLLNLSKNRAAFPEGSESIKEFVFKQAALFTAQWAKASKLEPNKPPAYPYDDQDKTQLAESIKAGHQLFLGKANCITCHYDYGRQSAYRYDIWGTLVRPRNLTEAKYRGGRRPIDLYWRLSGGIGPSNMAKLPPGMTDKEIWDLINFVQHLPYPAMLPEDLRDKIFGSEAK